MEGEEPNNIVITKGHHIEEWLNGVKTIDLIHEGGFCRWISNRHARRHTIVDVKAIYLRLAK